MHLLTEIAYRHCLSDSIVKAYRGWWWLRCLCLVMQIILYYASLSQTLLSLEPQNLRRFWTMEVRTTVCDLNIMFVCCCQNIRLWIYQLVCLWREHFFLAWLIMFNFVVMLKFMCSNFQGNSSIAILDFRLIRFNSLKLIVMMLNAVTVANVSTWPAFHNRQNYTMFHVCASYVQNYIAVYLLHLECANL